MDLSLQDFSTLFCHHDYDDGGDGDVNEIDCEKTSAHNPAISHEGFMLKIEELN
jgi:hypothetical protein